MIMRHFSHFLKRILLTLGLVLAVGCTSPKEIIREVPVEVIKTEYKTEYVHDSIYEHDSIFIAVNGDTVTKEVYKYKYLQNTVHDTLITHDTVPKILTVTETKVVEKKVPQWWPVYLTGGLLLLIGIGYLIYKFKNKISWLKF